MAGNDELPDIIPLGSAAPASGEYIYDPDSGATVFRPRRIRNSQDPNSTKEVTGYFDATGDQFARSWYTETEQDLRGELAGIMSKRNQIAALQPLTPEETLELSRLSTSTPTPVMPSGPYLNINTPAFQSQARLGELRTRQNRDVMLAQLEKDLVTKVAELNETRRILAEHNGTTAGMAQWDRAKGLGSSLRALVENPIDVMTGLMAENSVTTAEAAGAALALSTATILSGGGAGLAAGISMAGGAAVGAKDTYDQTLADTLMADPEFVSNPQAWIESAKRDPKKAELVYQKAKTKAEAAGLTEFGATMAAGGLTKLLPGGTTPIRKFAFDQLGEQFEEQFVGDMGMLVDQGRLMNAKERLATGLSTLGQGGVTHLGGAALGTAADKTGVSSAVSELFSPRMQVDTSTLTPMAPRGNPGQMAVDLNTLSPIGSPAAQAAPQAQPQVTPQLRVNTDTLAPVGTSAQEAPAAGAELPDVIPLGAPQASTGAPAAQAAPAAQTSQASQAGPQAAPQAQARTPVQPQAQQASPVSSLFTPPQTQAQAPQAQQTQGRSGTAASDYRAPQQGRRIVMVDPKKVLDSAGQGDPGFDIRDPQNQLSNNRGPRLAQAGAFLGDQNNRGQLEASRVGLRPDGSVAIGDGRHRLLAAQQAGLSQVGVDVSDEEAAGMARFAPDQNQAQPAPQSGGVASAFQPQAQARAPISLAPAQSVKPLNQNERTQVADMKFAAEQMLRDSGLPRATGAVASGRDEGGETQDKLTGGFESGAALYITARQFEGATREQAWSEILEKFKDNKRVATQAINAKDSIFQIADSLDGLPVSKAFEKGSKLASTRFPGAVSATEDAGAYNLQSDIATVYSNPTKMRDFAKRLKKIAGFKHDPSMSDRQVIDAFMKHVEGNLLHMFDSVPPEIRGRSKLWYVGANLIAKRLSEEHGISHEAAAGVLAVLSPQMDWYKNVSLAERALDIILNKSGHAVDQKMIDAMKARNAIAKIALDLQETKAGIPKEKRTKYPDDKDKSKRANAIRKKARDAVDALGLAGQKIGEIKVARLQAIALRAYDEAYNPRFYDVITPEGGKDGPFTSLDGEDADVAWGGFGTIEKCFAIVRDQSMENISSQLGGEHKVRNFYNNIIDPEARDGQVTIDTHAVAAALMEPLSGEDPEVKDNLGGAGGTDMTGLSGLYPIYAHAYGQAAKARGVLPREMQSITWEAVRGLFPATYKSNEQNITKIKSIWSSYRDGKIDIATARSQLEAEVLRARIEFIEALHAERKIDRAEADRRIATARSYGAYGRPTWFRPDGQGAQGAGSGQDQGQLDRTQLGRDGVGPDQGATGRGPQGPQVRSERDEATWNELERKAAELDRRRAARAQAQAGNTDPAQRRRGNEQIAQKLINELRRGGSLTHEEATAALRLVEKLMENGYLDNLAVSVSQAEPGAGVRGEYNAAAELVKLFVRNTNRPGVFKHTFAHEVAHHLERMVPAKDLEAARQQFLRDRAKWLKDKKGLRELLGEGNWLDKSFSHAQLIDFAKKNDIDMSQVSRLFRRDTNTGRWRLARTDETYRLTNFSEYFADTIADLAKARDDARVNSQNMPTVFAKLKELMSQIKKALMDVFGKDKVEAIWDKFQEGAYTSDFKRDKLHGYDRTGGQNPVMDDQRTADYRASRFGDADQDRQTRVDNIDKLEPNKPIPRTRSARDDGENTPIPGGYREAFFKAKQGAGAPEPKQIKFWTDLGHDPDADTTKQFLWSIDRRGQMHIISVSDLNDKMSAAGASLEEAIGEGTSGGSADWTRIPTHLDWETLGGEYDRNTGKDLGIPQDVLSGPAHGRIDATGDVIRVSLIQKNQSTPEIKADMQRYVKEKLGEAMGEDPMGLRGYDFTDAGPFNGPEVFSARDEEGPQVPRPSRPGSFKAFDEMVTGREIPKPEGMPYPYNLKRFTTLAPASQTARKNLAGYHLVQQGSDLGQQGKNDNREFRVVSKELVPESGSPLHEYRIQFRFEPRGPGSAAAGVTVLFTDEGGMNNATPEHVKVGLISELFERARQAGIKEIFVSRDYAGEIDPNELGLFGHVAKTEPDISFNPDGTGYNSYGIDKNTAYSARDEEPAQAPMSVEQRKARIEEIKQEITKITKGRSQLSREEGERYSKLGMELETHRFEMRAGRGLKLELIKPMQERESAIPSEIVKIASDELASNRGVFSALTEASLGVRMNQDTAVDVIMNGRNTNVSPDDLYSAFNKTREALRRHFGDTIVLYRAHGKQKQKATQNWHSTEAGAKEYGSNIERKSVSVDDIVAVNVGLRGAYEEFIVGKNPASSKATDGIEFTTPGGELTNHGDKDLANGGFLTREAMRIPAGERSRYSFAFAPDERSGGHTAQIKYDGKVVANLDMSSEVYEEGKGLIKLDMVDVEPAFQGRGLSTILQAEVAELGKRADTPVDTLVATVLDPKVRPLKSMQKILGKDNVDILESTTETTDENDQFGYEGSNDDLVEMAEQDNVDFYQRGQRFRNRVEVQGNVPQYTPEQRQLIKDINAAKASGNMAKARQLKAQFDQSVQDNGTKILSARDDDGENTIIPGGKREKFLKNKPAPRPTYYTDIGHDPAKAKDSYLFMMTYDGLVVKRVSDLMQEVKDNLTLGDRGVYKMEGKSYGVNIDELTHNDWEDMDDQFGRGDIKYEAPTAIAFGRIEVKDGKPYIALGSRGDESDSIVRDEGRKGFRAMIKDAVKTAIEQGEITGVSRDITGFDYSFVDGGESGQPAVFSARDEEPAGKPEQKFLDTDRLFLEEGAGVESLYSPTAKKNLPSGAKINFESMDEDSYDADMYGDPTGYQMTVVGSDGEILASADLVMDKGRVFTKRPKYLDGKIQRKEPKLEQGWAMTVETISGENARAQVAVAAEAVERAKMAGATMVLIPFKGWDRRAAVAELISKLEGDEDLKISDEIDALNIVFKQNTPDYAEVETGEAAYGIRRDQVYSARDEDTPSTGSTARKAGLAAGALALAPTTVEAATGAAKAAGATIAGIAVGDLISVASGIAFTSSDRLLKGLNPISANMHLLANDTRSKTMKRVAEMFNRLGGNTDAGAQETYHEERDANRRIFRNKLADAFEPLAKLSQDQIRALDITIARALAGEIPMPSGPVGQVVQNLQALSDELYTYLRQSGLELNYAQGYAIPHSFNAEAVAKDEQAFIDTAEQAYIDNNPKRIRSLQKYIQQIDQEAAQNGGFTQEMTDRKNAMLEEIKKLQVANPRQQAEDLAAAILSGAEGGDQSQGLILASNPRNQNRADFLKSRVFEHSARAMLREYFHNDPRHAWNNYIARATTLAEFSRRFGADGQTWNSMVEQMRKEGVKEVDITRIKEMVLDAMGALTPAAQGSHAMANALLGLSNMSKLKSTFLTNFLEAQAQAIPGNLLTAVTAPVVMLKEFAAIMAELSPRQRALLKQFLRVDLNSETGNMELARITGLMDSAGVHNIMENSAYALDNKADFREDSRTDRAARKISNATGRMAQAYGIEASENAKRAMGARYAAGRLDQHVSEFLRDNILARALKKVGYKGDAMTTRNEAIMRLRRAGVNDANMIAFGTWWEKARLSGKFNEMLADTTDPMAAMARKAIRMESARAMVNSNRAMKPGGERNKAISQDNFWGKAVMSFLNYPAAFREQIAKPMARDIASGFKGYESEGGQSTFFSPAERARMIARASAIPAMAVSAAAFLALRVLALGDEEDKEELKKKTLLNHMIDGLSYTGLTGGKTEAVQRARRGQLPPIIDEGVRLGKNFERESTKSNGKERAITKSLTRSVAVPGTQAVVSTYAPAPIAAVVDQALASKAFNELVVDTVAGKEKEKKKASSDSRTGSRESGRSSGRTDGR